MGCEEWRDTIDADRYGPLPRRPQGCGRRRFRLLIRAPPGFDLAAYLREWLNAAPKKHGSIKLAA